ncbi:DUF4406 domain-containing protein [Geothrix fuzhouensis]|uniref:DUF4406 domain-containing protein n=1 Tax=Geothrix fuzhouensis TaxID=2966451 RepID=UPI002148A881|nr:DUF4406 domain-containing protein [Geothrix fuzhouensis]
MPKPAPSPTSIVIPIPADCRTMAVLYVSGAISAPTPAGVEGNVRAARAWTTYLAELGYAPICPHTNIQDIGRLGYEDIMAVDFMLLGRCDGIFMMPGWEKSPGAVRERTFALGWGIRVYESVDELLASGLKRQLLPFQPRG